MRCEREFLHAHVGEHGLLSESGSAHRADAARAADFLGAVAAADEVAARENDIALLVSAYDAEDGILSSAVARG